MKHGANRRDALHSGLRLQLGLNESLNCINIEVVRPCFHHLVFLFVITTTEEIRCQLLHLIASLQELAIGDLVELAAEVVLSPLAHTSRQVALLVSLHGVILLLHGETFVGHLEGSILGDFDQKLEATFSHIPLVQEEAWSHRQELLEVRLLESALKAFSNH